MPLPYPLAFPLGGEGLSGGIPWIINIAPVTTQVNAQLLRPISFSIRDAESYIDPTTIRVKAGYASVHSAANNLFDKELPRTKRVALIPGVAGEPSISLSTNSIEIQRTSSSPQRSVYATSIDGGIGYKSVMATVVLRPDTISVADDSTDGVANNGAIIGLEHGPRNKVVYLHFQKHVNTTKYIRLTSYQKETGGPTLNVSVDFDWSVLRRYFLVWNENEGYLEFYGVIGTQTTLILRQAISGIPDMPENYFILAGTDADITFLYGQLGINGDQSTWTNVAVTTDVGYPVLGNIRPGDFVTTVRGSELITTTGVKDPRSLDISAWFTAPDSVIPALDPNASVAVDNGKFQMIKRAAGTFALYREEPALLASNSEGFAFTAKISATAVNQAGAATGMGITIYDGSSVFQFQMFDDFGVRTIGLLKKNGINDDITTYFLPSTPLDWTSRHTFRIVVDPRRDIIRFYDGDDLGTSIFSMTFDRSLLPDGTDFSWDGLTPFVVIGHTTPITAEGTFTLESFDLTHLYQAWDVEDAVEPETAPTNPIFTETSSGGAFSIIDEGSFVITSPTGGVDKFNRTIPFGAQRGGIVEAKLQITSWRPLSKTGVYLMLDDGEHVYAITFIDSSLGKFVALSRRDGLGGLQEVVGRDGDPATVSFLLDWTQPHIYRLERLAYGGVCIFVDADVVPKLVYPETNLAYLPDPLYSGTPTMAFGKFTGESSISKWSFVRGFFSRGYEVSFKKNKTDAVLRSELFNTQAMVIAHASDND